jgi:hypothetical protein
MQDIWFNYMKSGKFFLSFFFLRLAPKLITQKLIEISHSFFFEGAENAGPKKRSKDGK